MKRNTAAEWLWGKNAQVNVLMMAAFVLLLAWLGGREIWTQEHRWADIVSGMFFRHDFLHPYLGEANYYDKPLLSYWLIAAIASVTGTLNTWALRLPSALSGLVAIWSIYRLGTVVKNKQMGLVSGWLMLTSFYFVFWAKTSSADMLNLAGSLLAVTWYAEKRDRPSFFNYAVFFLIIAVTSLCKGLVGAVVPALVVMTDVVMRRSWKTYLNASFFLAMLPAAIVYFLPFWASSHMNGEGYGQNGLYLVYRENVLRYFQPFDHKGPIYTYLIFLPVYLMPWAIFFFPALANLKARWRSLSHNEKWVCWSVLVLFIFFTLSGSRRNYYVLPMVPFAIIMTADWILAAGDRVKRFVWAGRVAVTFFIALFLNFDVIQPLYYAQGGMQHFAVQLQTEASSQQPWEQWHFVMLDPESKIRFYLHLSPEVKSYGIEGGRSQQTTETLTKAWPIVREQPENTILLTRKHYAPLLHVLLPTYRMVVADASLGERLLHIENQNAPVAFIPVKR